MAERITKNLLQRRAALVAKHQNIRFRIDIAYGAYKLETETGSVELSQRVNASTMDAILHAIDRVLEAKSQGLL